MELLNVNISDYSNRFKKLLDDKDKIQSFVDGNQVVGVDFNQWTKIRSFISKSINKDGKFLDIGCANGFLLRCLQEWCDYKIEPYGIDKNRDSIKQAKELFPLQRKNFIVKDLFELAKSGLEDLSKHGLPARYDFIYWNVWDTIKFADQKEVDLVKKFLEAVSPDGRLVLGFYNNDNKQNMEDMKKIKKLEEKGFNFSGVLDNGLNDIIAWIDK